MSLLHVFVAQDTAVVAEALSPDLSAGASQLMPQTRVLLATCARDVSPAMKRVSLEGDRHFLYVRDGRMTFGCIVAVPPHAHSEQLVRHGFDFLSAVKEAYSSSVAEDDLRSPFAASLATTTFQIDAILSAWNGAQYANPDRIVQIERGLDEATAQLAENARAVKERGDKLDQLSVASSAVFASADNYRAYAGELQQKARDRKVRLIAASTCAALVLLWLFW
jgi:hypothetical protein